MSINEGGTKLDWEVFIKLAGVPRRGYLLARRTSLGSRTP